MGRNMARMVMVVMLKGVAAHGHVGVEVGRADAAWISRPVRRRWRKDGTYVKTHICEGNK